MGFDLKQYKADLDGMLAPTMPDSWLGHARLKIHERGFENPEHEHVAIKSVRRVLNKHDMSAERAAELVIEKVEEKYS